MQDPMMRIHPVPYGERKSVMILRAVAAFLLVLVVIPLGMGKALITGESGRLSFVGGYFASLFYI